MAEIDEFASSLLEEAKRFFELAIDHDDTSAKDAYLHSALMLAFCSLEAHVNAIAAELSEREEFSLQERALLLEKETKLEDGHFVLGAFRMYRLEDRILFLHRKFAGKALNKAASWWGQLKRATVIRNKLTHPKSAQPIVVEDVREALEAIIASLDMLYQTIYRKGLPAANRGLHSRLTF